MIDWADTPTITYLGLTVQHILNRRFHLYQKFSFDELETWCKNYKSKFLDVIVQAPWN